MRSICVDLEWEFNAPQWYDFTCDENDNADSWFEEEERKTVRGFTRRPSRIPIFTAKKPHLSSPEASFSKESPGSPNPPERQEYRNVYGKRPVRVLVQAKRNTR
jgi:hypothetical protein